jgi:hypothetical protein
MSEPIPRRNILRMGAGAAAAAGTAFVIGTGEAGAADTVPTYRLDPSPSAAHCRVPVRARTKHQKHVERQAQKKQRIEKAQVAEEKAKREAEQRKAAMPPEERAKRDAERKADEERKVAEEKVRVEAEQKAEQSGGLTPEKKAQIEADKRARELEAMTPEERDKRAAEQAALEAKAQAAADKRVAAKRGCAACNACINHGKNKVFATKEAADRDRAHKGCKCTVAEGPALSRPIYDALFTENKHDSVDRRDPKVASFLQNPDAESVPVPILAPAVPLVIAVAGGAWWWHARRNARIASASGDGGPDVQSGYD